MSLELGATLGVYEILASIGVGGMGEVFRAKDTKLGREVAIKVLPEALRRDPERLARFEREARVLASLNHPGIATLHGLETQGEITYLVMELVSGETLQERLARGPLAIDEARDLFRQIAEALEAAHAAGVVHRDLKPANIKITTEGRAKVLDFGLAKAFAADEPANDLSHSPTLTRDATAAGVILGTASYMSPEQAKGKLADKRADIWAFGCVLYEALSGKKAFDGESVTDVLANVIHKDVVWGALPAETPWRVRDVLRRCLVKDTAQRFHDVADARIELDADEPTAPSESPSSFSKSRLLAVGLMGVIVTALVLRGEAPRVTDVQRFVITPSASEPLELETPIVSPDGRRIAYIGTEEERRQLYLRELDELESRPLDGTQGAYSPFFSPDGMWVGFFAGGKLKKISVLGGAPIDICDAYSEGPGGAWTLNDTIWFSGNWNSGFFEVSADGGEPVPITTPDRERGEIGHWWPDFLWDGKKVVFTIFTDEGAHRIAVLDLSSGTWKYLFPGMQARYAPSGHIVFYRSGIYQVVPFDAKRGEVQGSPVPVLGETRGIGPTGDADRYFDVSDTGMVVSVPGGAIEPRSFLTWLGLDGRAETAPFESASIHDFRLDRSGRLAAVTRVDGGMFNVWIYDLESGTEEKITQGSNNFQPQWMPDGRRIVFTTARRGQYDIFVKPLDALGTEGPIVTRVVDESSEALSPDGRWLAISEFQVETGQDIAIVDLQEGSEPVPAAKTSFQENAPHFSRDSVWLAYQSNASGRPEIYVQAVADATGRMKVSSNGGSTPRWSPVEDELYYVLGNVIMAVGYEISGGEFRARTTRTLVELPERHLTGSSTLEISSDGKRFLIVVDSGEDPPPTELHVTTNWTEELTRLTESN